ncbi:hypothetical protein [Sphingomonas asaccharolytica]|uniref:hypothetical protein n=1 Tax=Sphingomonas asaccharolytica TaxID=40681 RepID=UPI00082ECBBC|nr:hypothetical protein [Sphingomonas asaccharolytica]
MPSRQIVWLSFDMGLRGDLEGLYAWLDQHKAKECGDGVAFLEYAHDGKTLPDKLKADLEKSVTFDKRSRIYVIWRNNAHNMKGRFIVGSRRAAPWVGMAPGAVVDDDEG